MERDLWPGVELRLLQTLRAIEQEGSLQGAAAALGYAQPAVSQHLAALEAITGHRLVERRRGSGTATLTEAGLVLVAHADAVAARIRAAQADLRALADGSAGTLRVGTYQSVSARIVPSLLQRFATQWPGVTVELQEGPDDAEMLDLLVDGTLDVAFGGPPPPDGPFAWAEVLSDPWFLLVPSDAPLASHPGPLAVRQLAGLSLVAFRSAGSAQTALEAYLRANGLDPRIIFRTDDNATVQGLVATGYGVALFPALAIDMSDPHVVRIPVDVPPRTIAISWLRDRMRSAALDSFVATAQAVAGEVRAGVASPRSS